MRDTMESLPGQAIIVCLEDDASDSVAIACQLFGAYMVLCEDLGLERVPMAFIPDNLSSAVRSTIGDCWEALRRVDWGQGRGGAALGGVLDVHELALDARRPALLGAMDRLLAISRAEHVGTLGAAWLMTGFGFRSGGAAAWIRMMGAGLRARAPGAWQD